MNRNGKVALTVLGVLGVALTLALVGLVVFLVSRQPSQPASDEEKITTLFWEMRADVNRKLKESNRRNEILEIQIEDGWAILGYGSVYLDTGKPVPAGPGLMIFRKMSGQWKGEDRGSPLFKQWLEEIPESLIPPATKEYLH